LKTTWLIFPLAAKFIQIDHDSICKFRCENKANLTSVFHQILELTATAKIIKVADLTCSIEPENYCANCFTR